MKKLLFILTAGVAVFSFGCGKKTPVTTATKTPGVQDLSNLDDSQKASVQRMEYTDPALYSYLQEAAKREAPTATATLPPGEQRKINKQVRFSASSRYGVKGTAEILSPQIIEVASFAYNAGCGPATLALGRQDKPNEKIATLKEISAACDSCAFSLNIPSNISLSQFDSISLFCNSISEPISSAVFTGS